MFPEPSDLPFSFEQLEHLTDQLEHNLSNVGCYTLTTGLQCPTDDEGNEAGPPFLVIICQIGNVAWSPRVQNPEMDKVDDEIRSMEADQSEEEFEAIRRHYKEMRERGEDPFA